MSDDDPTIVREEKTRDFGIYHPEENEIETYIGDDEIRLSGEYYGDNWHDTSQCELTESIKADIEDVREMIDELHEADLTAAQQHELIKMESRVEQYERMVELAEEVRGDAE